MKVGHWTAAALIALLIAASPSAAETDQDRTRLLPLLESKVLEQSVGQVPGARLTIFKDGDIKSQSFGTELCVFEVPLARGALKITEPKKQGEPRAIHAQTATASTLAVVTGGFFGLDPAGNPVPLGLIKRNGQVTNAKHPWQTGGVVVASGNRAAILPIRNFKDSNAWSEVVQSKPLLVENEVDGIRAGAPERFDRSAIALTKNNEVLFAVLHEPGGRAGNLAEFSSVLLAYRSSTNSVVRNAIAMDGGPGAHLFVPPLQRHCGSGVPNYVPNLVTFERK